MKKPSTKNGFKKLFGMMGIAPKETALEGAGIAEPNIETMLRVPGPPEKRSEDRRPDMVKPTNPTLTPLSIGELIEISNRISGQLDRQDGMVSSMSHLSDGFSRFDIERLERIVNKVDAIGDKYALAARQNLKEPKIEELEDMRKWLTQVSERTKSMGSLFMDISVKLSQINRRRMNIEGEMREFSNEPNSREIMMMNLITEYKDLFEMVENTLFKVKFKEWIASIVPQISFLFERFKEKQDISPEDLKKEIDDFNYLFAHEVAMVFSEDRDVD